MRLLLLVPLLLAACACSDESGAAPPPDRGMTEAEAAAVPIRNFARVDDGLYRGAQPDEAGFAALRAMGVRTIVNLRYVHSDADDIPRPVGGAGPAGAETESAPDSSAPPGSASVGLDLVEIPLHALLDSDPPTDEDLRTFLDVVLDPARRPVYVHCAHGKDRTGTMCAVYRMEVQGWTAERAFEEMQAFGFHDLYTDLERFVKSYTPRGFGKR